MKRDGLSDEIPQRDILVDNRASGFSQQSRVKPQQEYRRISTRA